MQWKLVGVVAVAMTSVSAIAAAEWGYDGHTGPEHWGQLAEGYEACAIGVEQSPINLVAAEAHSAKGPQLELEWLPLVPAMLDNGHTLELQANGLGGGTTYDGVRYELLQMHLHHQSEHAIDGEHAPLEAHFVHVAEGPKLLVVGVMLQPGEANEVLDYLLSLWPDGVGDVVAGHAVVDLTALLPTRRASFRYQGSLTTPPCSQIVSWVVMAEPVEVSAEQIATFAARYPNNARPLQPLHDRALSLVTP
jgi:Carbonic anhydrase